MVITKSGKEIYEFNLNILYFNNRWCKARYLDPKPCLNSEKCFQKAAKTLHHWNISLQKKKRLLNFCHIYPPAWQRNPDNFIIYEEFFYNHVLLRKDAKKIMDRKRDPHENSNENKN